MERLFLMFLDHTHELITRPEESYPLRCVVVCDLETSRIGAPYIYNISSLRVKYKAPTTIVFLIWRNSLQWAKASSFTRFLDHTQRRTTVGRTPLDE